MKKPAVTQVLALLAALNAVRPLLARVGETAQVVGEILVAVVGAVLGTLPLWQWLRTQLPGWETKALEKCEAFARTHMPDRFTPLKDECRPEYIKHFGDTLAYQLESGWLVYGVPTIEQWLECAGGDAGNLTVHQERRIVKWRDRQVQRRSRSLRRRARKRVRHRLRPAGCAHY